MRHPTLRHGPGGRVRNLALVHPGPRRRDVAPWKGVGDIKRIYWNDVIFTDEPMSLQR